MKKIMIIYRVIYEGKRGIEQLFEKSADNSVTIGRDSTNDLAPNISFIHFEIPLEFISSGQSPHSIITWWYFVMRQEPLVFQFRKDTFVSCHRSLTGGS